MTNNFTDADVEESEEILWSETPHFASLIGQIILGIMLIPLGIGLLVLAKAYIRLNYTNYALTDKAVYKHTGWLSTQRRRIPLEQIQKSDYTSSWVEKQFEFGTIGISSAGSSGTDIQFKSVPKPKAVSEKIDSLSQKRKADISESVQRQHNQSATDQELAQELRETRKNLEEIIELFK